MNTEKILATMLFHKDKRISCYELNENDFETDRHKKIFNEIKNNMQTSPSELASMLSQKNLIDIAEFSEQSDKKYFDSFLSDVKAQSRKKLGKIQLFNLMKKYNDLSGDEVYEEMVRIAAEIKVDDHADYTSLGEAMDSTLEEVDRARKGEYEKIKIPFVEGLLRKQSGGELNIIGGRPSMGKSAVLLNMAEEMVMNGLPVGLISFEMETVEITNRILQKYWDKPLSDEAENFTDEEYAKLQRQKEKYSTLPFYIRDKHDSYLSTTLATIDKMVKIDGVKVVLIDYLQLMSVKGNSYNRTLELGAISRALKTTAMENKIVIMAAAQLSRGVEQREDKRPMLSDLRDSGALEQDADNVMFVYRDEYYRNDPKTKGKVDIIVAKQRNGAIGTRTLLYDKERQLIQRMNY